jgi:uncharacterized protein (TIGR04255 family)
MKFPESQRVKYNRNPLVEVICQLRFPKILKIETEAPVSFQESIRSEYPVLNTSRAVEFSSFLNPQANLPPITLGQGLTYEFLDKSGKYKLVLSSDFIALSTSDYQNWEDFRGRLSNAIRLLVSCYAPSHFTRIGLRYQDLILRSELELQNHEWKSLLKPPILGTFIAADLSENDFIEAFSVFAHHIDSAGSVLRVQYGLARKNQSEELGYLIDTDFYTDNIMEINNATSLLDTYNREAGNFFRWCITNKLEQALQPQPIGQRQ